MKGKRIFSLLLATVCLLANTAAPALAAESIKEEVNEKNYIDIITYLQKNKYDSNNFLIDTIIKEEDEEKNYF